MDTITKNFLNEFSESNNLNHMKECDKFELFSNYCVINKEYDSVSFDLKNTLTGKATQGIDGIAFIINNKLCTSKKEIEDIIEMNRVLNANIIIIQSKVSSSFSSEVISSIFDWTKTFFIGKECLFKTDEMKNFVDMKNCIYDNSKYMKERSPKCTIYYCTSGKWMDDRNLNQIIDLNISELDNTNLFDKVEFVPVDAKKIQSLYRNTKEPVEATIKFERKVTLPKIENVEVAYSGLLPFEEFKKIVIDENDKVKSVFDDNIRDYLESDDNQVNIDIANTLFKKDYNYFGILNNGVTVVAEKIAGTGDEITITNYQIVNGCQTSHVLYENRNLEGIHNVNVPLKVIITDNIDIKSKITRATNNQTAVGIEQLEALSEVQKNLELHYNALPIDDYKLYYERRTNQYKNKEIPQFRVVSVESQVKSFAGMFLGKANMVAGYYGKLTKDMGSKIFNPAYLLDPYYVSSISYFMLEELFDEMIIEGDLWRFRYYILHVFRSLIEFNPKPAFTNKKKSDKMCKAILDIIKDKEKFESKILESVFILKSDELGLNFSDRKMPERKGTVDLIDNFLIKKYNMKAAYMQYSIEDIF